MRPHSHCSVEGWRPGSTPWAHRVEREGDQVDVPRALTVPEKRPLNTLSTCQQSEAGRGDRRARGSLCGWIRRRGSAVARAQGWRPTTRTGRRGRSAWTSQPSREGSADPCGCSGGSAARRRAPRSQTSRAKSISVPTKLLGRVCRSGHPCPGEPRSTASSAHAPRHRDVDDSLPGPRGRRRGADCEIEVVGGSIARFHTSSRSRSSITHKPRGTAPKILNYDVVRDKVLLDQGGA